jgi:hypothetical protein
VCASGSVRRARLQDTDKSGKVSKDEFFENYAKASKEIVNVEEVCLTCGFVASIF